MIATFVCAPVERSGADSETRQLIALTPSLCFRSWRIGISSQGLRTTKELHLSAIRAGTVLTVYYTSTMVKVDGKKIHTNLIWGIRFDLVNGQKLTDPDRPIISCSHQQTAPFRAFN